MNPKLEQFYLNKEEPYKSCLLALREIILKQDALITNELKYGMPMFCYKGKMFCYLWTDKKTNQPYIGFVEGNRLNHSKLEQGNRARMKILPINANADLPKNLIQDLLKQALDFYRDGIIKI